MARKGRENRGVYEQPPGSGRFLIDYIDQTGHRKREVVGQCADHPHPKDKRCPMQVRARNLAAQRRKDVRNARLFPAPPPVARATLLTEVMRDYLKESEATKRSYADDKRYAEAWGLVFFGRALDDVRPAEIEHWRQEQMSREESPISPATANRYVAFLKHVYNVAIRDGLTEKNPVTRVKLLREDNSRIRWLRQDKDLDEEAALRKELDPEIWERYVLVAIDTGLRQSEQFSLRWEDCDMARRLITVRQSKSGRMRHIPMTDAVYQALLRMPSRLKSEWVYPAPSSSHRNSMAKKQPPPHLTFPSIRKTFESAVEKAQLNNFRWHDLRHTFASRLVMAGAGLRDVMDLMGHASLTMVLRYAHLSPAHQRDAIARLEGSHGPTLGQTSTKLPQASSSDPQGKKRSHSKG
ncbi:MAG: tyrosine-type recombinase/integrase [Phycisphaerales bacterium]